ncbi:cell division protease FtsH [Anaerolineae bacterium]|nr:cell division protease FtsH [Anaerolineae bacterium]
MSTTDTGFLKKRSPEEIGGALKAIKKKRMTFKIREMDALAEKVEVYLSAVNAAYDSQIGDIKRYIERGVSVLVYADQQIVPYLIGWVMQDKEEVSWEGMQAIKDGNPPDGCCHYLRIGTTATHLQENRQERGLQPADPRIVPVNLLERTVSNLHFAVKHWKDTPGFRIFVLEELDLLVGSACPDSHLTEIVYELRQVTRQFKQRNERPVLLAFADLGLGRLPESVEVFFPKVITLGGVGRNHLWQLLKDWNDVEKLFGSEATSSLSIQHQLTLAKYLAGTNPVRASDLLEACIAGGASADSKDLEKRLRALTVGSETIPSVEKDMIAGYLDVKAIIEGKVITPIKNQYSPPDRENENPRETPVPRGVLLYGPPGTGKTELAKWIATELQATLQTISGPELKSKWVGETEQHIRTLFTKARQSTPAVILIDEVDALMPTRRHDSQEHAASMVAQLLTEMDGLRPDEAITVIGTTNQIQNIDPGFLRPGRFWPQIKVDYPSQEDVVAILKYYSKDLECFDPERLAAQICQRDEWEEDAHAKMLAALDSKLLGEVEAKEIYRALAIQEHVKKLKEVFPDARDEQLESQAQVAITRKHWSGDHLRAFCEEWSQVQRQIRAKLSSSNNPSNDLGTQIAERVFRNLERDLGVSISRSPRSHNETESPRGSRFT